MGDKKEEKGSDETFFRVKRQPTCKKCGKNAYSAESVKYDGENYHNTCFKCYICKHTLTLSGIAQLNSELYCKDCFTKTFKEKGGTYNVFRERGAADLPSFEGGPRKLNVRTDGRKNYGPRPKTYNEDKECWQCYKPLAKTVMHAIDHKWHPECFTCFTCWSVFGPEVAVTLVDDRPFCNQECAEGRTCHGCKKLILGDVAEALGKKWHDDCFNCEKCQKHLGGDCFVIRSDKPTLPLCELCGAGFNTARD